MPVVIVAAGLLLLGGAILIAQATTSASADPNFTPRVMGAPSLDVEQPFFDLGDVHFNTMAEVSYVLRNVGDQPLRILEAPQVEVLEGC
jgi:hypothetical protein